VKTLVVIQARLGSTRLPGKVLLPLAGKPLLERMIERVRAARSVIDIVVATTLDPADDPIRQLCRSLDVDCYSGHPTDLLDRHYRCALERGADNVVKIPSDCPLIDPNIIDLVLSHFFACYPRFDYVSNLHPATFPDGNDVEIIKLKVLGCAWEEARLDFEREHTTPFIWERPERYSCDNVSLPNQNYSLSHRWTIDYKEDYEFISTVYLNLWNKRTPVFTMHDILDFIGQNPEVANINAKFAGVNWYRNHLHELKTIQPHETRQEWAA